MFVVLTMRSDHLGDCDDFLGLPEALNESQYLVPRLNRDEVRLAIEGPIRLFQKNAAPRLVDRLRYSGNGGSTGSGAALVDISHESLIRRWSRLRNWVKAETTATHTCVCATTRNAGKPVPAAFGQIPGSRPNALVVG